MNRITEKYKNFYIIGILLLNTVVFCFPLFGKEGLSGNMNDAFYHLYRIEGVFESIQQGEYPARIYSSMLNSYGYGSGLFYPDIFLTIPAFMRMFGIPPILTYKIFLAVITVLIQISTYFSAKYIMKSSYGAIIATCALTLSQFYIADVYNRCGLSEYIAYIFLPICLAGTYDLLECEFKKSWLWALGFAGLILSHSIMFACCTLCIGIFIMFHFPNLVKKPKIIGKLIWVTVLTCGITSFYWGPMLEQFGEMEFGLDKSGIYVSNYTQPVITWLNLKGGFNIICYAGIGYPIILGCLARLFTKNEGKKWFNRIFLAGILILISTTRLFPWKIFDTTLLNNIQFTYRLYPMALLFLCIALGYTLDKMFAQQENRKLFLYICVCFCVMCALPELDYCSGIDETSMQVNEQWMDNPENTMYIGLGEWLPAGTDTSLLNTPYYAKNDAEELIEVDKNGLTLTFESDGISDSYDIPYIYYKGYKCYITDEHGEKTAIDVTQSENNGLVKVSGLEDRRGTVTVYYGDTVIQTVSLICSIGIIAIWGLYVIFRWKGIRLKIYR
mgnify:CR=1 FL=1